MMDCIHLVIRKPLFTSTQLTASCRARAEKRRRCEKDLEQVEAASLKRMEATSHPAWANNGAGLGVHEVLLVRKDVDMAFNPVMPLAR